MLKGSCHPGGGRAASECVARFAVGGWSKALRVLGPRVWGGVTGGSLGEPAPFTSMPLTWQNAFGGPGYAKNPVGKGVAGPEGPNVELEGSPVRSRSGSYEPAPFGPIKPNWSARGDLPGSEYGAAWRKKRAPFYAEYFDWRYFYSAPAAPTLSTAPARLEIRIENSPKAGSSEPTLPFETAAPRLAPFTIAEAQRSVAIRPTQCVP